MNPKTKSTAMTTETMTPATQVPVETPATREPALPVFRPRHTTRALDGAYEVDVMLPGVRRDDVEVRFEDETLTVRARRPLDVPEGWRVLRREIQPREYQLELAVRVPVNAEAITARMDNGVLTLHLPLRNEALARQIAVQ